MLEMFIVLSREGGDGVGVEPGKVRWGGGKVKGVGCSPAMGLSPGDGNGNGDIGKGLRDSKVGSNPRCDIVPPGGDDALPISCVRYRLL